jgi:hypothetical protein
MAQIRRVLTGKWQLKARPLNECEAAVVGCGLFEAAAPAFSHRFLGSLRAGSLFEARVPWSRRKMREILKINQPIVFT